MEDIKPIMDKVLDISRRAVVRVRTAGETASGKIDSWRYEQKLKSAYASLGLRVFDMLQSGQPLDEADEIVVRSLHDIRQLQAVIDDRKKTENNVEHT